MATETLEGHWRALGEGDIAAAAALSASFGWPHRTDDWRAMLALGRGIALAAPNGELMATGVHWNMSPEVATLGLVIVGKAYQRRGLGDQMMRRLIDGCGHRAILLHATAAGKSLYEAHGFVAGDDVVQYQGQVAGPVASSEVRLAQQHEYAAIRRLDAVAFGGERTAVMDHLLATGVVRVIDRVGSVCGFAVCRSFGRGRLIGPVIAPDEAAAKPLIDASLEAGFNRIDLYRPSPDLIAHVNALGLGEAGQVVAMVRGAWPAPNAGALPGPSKFALASQALG